LLVERGADLTARAKLPGHYERLHEIVEGTALGYALRFPDSTTPSKTAAYLRERKAPE
jgi:hypothetical protein